MPFMFPAENINLFTKQGRRERSRDRERAGKILEKPRISRLRLSLAVISAKYEEKLTHYPTTSSFPRDKKKHNIVCTAV